MANSTLRFIYRHTITVRVTHWINVLCISLLLMSGMQIFNAHPALYWGKAATFSSPFLSMTASRDGETPRGVTKIGGLAFDTTGFLGVSRDKDGDIQERAFPSWLTVPSFQDLATGRRWHFLFAWIFVINGLIYLLFSLFSGHIGRDLMPSLQQLKGIGRSIIDHALLRFHHGEDARDYNVLQKLAYLGVIAILFLIVLTGLCMSPGMNAALPWLPELFGGRQSARSIHFFCATLTVLFIFVHLVMVLLTGVWNNVRSMITGRFGIAASPATSGAATSGGHHD